MKKAFTTIILVTLAVTAASGEPVSKSQASLTAKSFLKDRERNIETTSGSGGATGSIRSVDDSSQPYYVFNAEDGEAIYDNYKFSRECDNVITGGGDLTQHYSITLGAYGYAEGDTIVAEFRNKYREMLTEGTVEFVLVIIARPRYRKSKHLDLRYPTRDISILGQDATGMQPAAAHEMMSESGKAYTITGVQAPEGYRGVIITASRKKVVR